MKQQQQQQQQQQQKQKQVYQQLYYLSTEDKIKHHSPYSPS